MASRDGIYVSHLPRRLVNFCSLQQSMCFWEQCSQLAVLTFHMNQREFRVLIKASNRLPCIIKGGSLGTSYSNCLLLKLILRKLVFWYKYNFIFYMWEEVKGFKISDSHIFVIKALTQFFPAHSKEKPWF